MSAIETFRIGSDSMTLLLWYWLGSILLAWLPVVMLRRRFTDSPGLTYLFFLLFMLVVPFIGWLFAFWIAWVLRSTQVPEENLAMKTIHLEEYFVAFPKVHRRFGEGALYSLTQQQKLPSTIGIVALTMLAEFKDKISFRILRGLHPMLGPEVIPIQS